MHADRLTRLLLTLLAVLLLAAGAGALILSVGGLGKNNSRKDLLANQTGRYIGHHGGWIWAATAVVCAFIAMACLLWLRALLLSTDRAGDLTLPGDRSQGASLVKPAAITAALTAELDTYRGVDSARARVIGDSYAPQLVVTVTATRGTDLTPLRERIEREALHHTRTALDNPTLPIQLDLAAGQTAATRTR